MLPLLLWLLTPSAPAAPPRGQVADMAFDQVALGEAHGCGRLGDGTVRCWGRNDRGQLGAGHFEPSAYPLPVEGLEGVVALAAGAFHTCAVRRDRTVACWGDNQTGQLGAGADVEASVVPLEVDGLTATLLSLGATHSCAITLAGDVVCWGNNLYGQLGVPGLRTSPVPVPVPGVSDVTTLATGYGHTCVGGRTGGARCWGDNRHGELGRPLPDDGEPLPPGPVEADLGVFRALGARGTWTCGLHAEGVHCWGATPTQEAPQPAPAQVVAQRGLLALSVGWGHGCGLTGSGKVTCFGDDRFGQLGSRYDRDPVFGAYGLTDALGVAAGNGETCAARGRRERVACWGAYTPEEVAAARQEQGALRRDLDAGPAPLRLERVPPPNTTLTVKMSEMLTKAGPKVRLEFRTVEQQACANAQLDRTFDIKGRKVIVELAEPFLPGGECIAEPAPAVGLVELPVSTSGLVNLVVRWRGKEDFYQLYLKLKKLEAIPLQQTFSAWEGSESLHRVPEGSLAITCLDHVEHPMCNRRLRDGLPGCASVVNHPAVVEAPKLDEGKEYANRWFMTDDHAIRISPDFRHEGFRTLIEESLMDPSGCMEVRARTWTGDVWSNAGPE